MRDLLFQFTIGDGSIFRFSFEVKAATGAEAVDNARAALLAAGEPIPFPSEVLKGAGWFVSPDVITTDHITGVCDVVTKEPVVEWQ